VTEDEARLAVADAHRSEWTRVVAATLRAVRDLDVADEAVQDAFTEALTSWVRDGVPKNPGAWLTTAAKRRAIDLIRRATTYRAKVQLLVEPDSFLDEDPPEMPRKVQVEKELVGDDTLRLIFMCCHPSLSADAQMALTLRLVCGMDTVDIARCFLVSQTTMAARLTRAKKKIAIARIPFIVPRGPDVPARLDAVLGVIYLLFTMGHTAPSGETLVRNEVVVEAIRLARLLHEMAPSEREVAGLLALVLVNDARRESRLDVDGRALRISEQDRSLWDHEKIYEASGLVATSGRAEPPGRYCLQAGIALLHTTAPTYADVDWSKIVRLYDELLRIWPSPVVELNRAVALSNISGSEVALEVIESLESDGRLDRYHYLPAAKAYLLDQLGRGEEAETARARAYELADNEIERKFISERVHGS